MSIMEQQECGRYARVNRDDDGQTLGCAVVLTADDLCSLDIPNDAERLVYAITDGQLRIDTVPES